MTRRIFLSVSSFALLAFIASSVVSVRAAQTAGVAGIWKLNEAESNNPNGPAPSQGGARRGGRGGGGEDMTGGAARAGAGAQQASELTAEETTRVRAMLRAMDRAAQTLEIVVEGPDVTIKQEGGGFPKQNAEGKKVTLKPAAFGEINIKVKIDAKGMTREITTQDDLKVVETYALSADGKQLIVTLKASQPVMKIEDAKIKRVYDRQ